MGFRTSCAVVASVALMTLSPAHATTTDIGPDFMLARMPANSCSGTANATEMGRV